MSKLKNFDYWWNGKDWKKKDIALKFGISPNNLSTIIKNRHNIEKDSSTSCSKRLKTCAYEDVSVSVLKWICLTWDSNVPEVSRPLTVGKSPKLAKEFGYDESPGSSGYIATFKKRYGIIAKVTSVKK